MSRGATLGERRRRRRREGRPRPVPAGRSRTPTWVGDFSTAPGWVRRLWLRPGPRLLFSLGWVALSVWILRAGYAAPGEPWYFRRADGGFGSALVLLVGFGVQSVEALLDLLRGTNTRPFLVRAGRWMEDRFGYGPSVALLFAPTVLWLVFGR